MRELPAGFDAVLLDFSAEPAPQAAVGRAASALRRAVESGALQVADLIPSGQTLLVQSERGSGVDILGIHRALRGLADIADEDSTPREVRIPVTYDGPDLAGVADILGITVDDVIEIHRSTVWRVQFMGFAPGFGYLVPHDVPDHPFEHVGRRDEARTRVPAGSVALAAGYSAVYPRVSPGGWHLLGSTTITLWDETATPPALLEPGSLVRFVDG